MATGLERHAITFFVISLAYAVDNKIVIRVFDSSGKVVSDIGYLAGSRSNARSFVNGCARDLGAEVLSKTAYFRKFFDDDFEKAKKVDSLDELGDELRTAVIMCKLKE